MMEKTQVNLKQVNILIYLMTTFWKQTGTIKKKKRETHLKKNPQILLILFEKLAMLFKR